MLLKPVAAGLARTTESVRLFAPNLCEGYAHGTVMASEAAGAQLMRDSPLRRVARGSLRPLASACMGGRRRCPRKHTVTHEAAHGASIQIHGAFESTDGFPMPRGGSTLLHNERWTTPSVRYCDAVRL